ncbi:MAG: sensor signal transduction histidine kinase [Rhodospirillales bacterium]|nr:sensor signal transduction histidine kinase [Rhodospirillales bacterium]
MRQSYSNLLSLEARPPSSHRRPTPKYDGRSTAEWRILVSRRLPWKGAGVENELSSVVDALPGWLWTALPDGHVDFVNRRWCEYSGLPVDDAFGRGWQTAVHPEDLTGLVENWRAILASGQPGEIEARLRRADGEYRWFLFRLCPLADASGKVVKWCGISTDIEERRRAEEAKHTHWWLSPSTRESHFRSINDSIPALAALMIPGIGVELVNRRTLEYFGTTLDELKSESNTYRIHSEDLVSICAVSARGEETGQPWDFEARLLGANGVYRWFHTSAFPLRDTEGRIVLWYYLQTDIDDRKRAELLLAGEKRLVEMVAWGHPLSVILDALCQHVESTISECYCGVELVDRSGRCLEHGAAPSLPPGFTTYIGGQPVNVDSGPCAMAACLNQQIIVADIASETRWAAHPWCPVALTHGLRSCWSTPISSTLGKVLGALAIYHSEPKAPTPRDQALIEQFLKIASIAIERTQSDALLRRSEAFLAEAQRLSSTGGFSWRVATNEITWSAEVYRVFEIEPAGPLTPEITDSRVHPEDLPMLYQKVNQARIDGKDFEFEYRLVMPDQSIKYLYTVFHRTQGQDGELEFVGAIQDVTERRRSEEALSKIRSELAHMARVTSLGALTASIAHEVNQPLSGIVTNASTCLRMLAADPPNVDGARETARRTIRDGNRASDVITRLRALFAKKSAMTEMVDLNEAAQDVISLSLNELRRNRVILRSEFADDLPPVTGDRVQLQQVVLNLVLNASDAMSGVDDRPRLLVVKTERDQSDYVRLSVRDAGVGIDPGDTEKLFEAFHTTKSNGMGVGLFVSRSIIESHRGRLWAAPNDGQGATFSFSIPCSPECAAGTYPLGGFRMAAAANTKRIMRK